MQQHKNSYLYPQNAKVKQPSQFFLGEGGVGANEERLGLNQEQLLSNFAANLYPPSKYAHQNLVPQAAYGHNATQLQQHQQLQPQGKTPKRLSAQTRQAPAQTHALMQQQQQPFDYYQSNKLQQAAFQMMSTNDKLSSTQTSTVTQSAQSSSNHRQSRKVIMRLSKSPFKGEPMVQPDNTQKPQEFIMKLLKNDKKSREQYQQRLAPAGGGEAKASNSNSSWILESHDNKIVMKASPKKMKQRFMKHRNLEQEEEESFEEQLVAGNARTGQGGFNDFNQLDMEVMKKELLSDSDDNDDSYDQLDVGGQGDRNDDYDDGDADDSEEEEDNGGMKVEELTPIAAKGKLQQPKMYQQYQQLPKRGSFKQAQSPSKKSSSSYSNEEMNSSNYSPHKVVAKMLLRKDRKIPNSVYKPHSETVLLVSSTQFNQSQPSQRVFFPYPKYCQRQDQAPSFLQVEMKLQETRYIKILEVTEAELKRNNMILGFKMTETTHIYNAVVNSLKNAGFRIQSPGSSKWNVTWTGVTKPEMLKDMCRLQRINHFPQSCHLGRKDLMWKNIQRLKKTFPQDYDICPATYLLPDDYKKLLFEREADHNKSLYIIKPNASSCGKGIQILGPQDSIPKKGGYLISKYVANPHLIEGLKYDLRIYVLVTSYDPLKIYLFREGLTRFATEKYSTNLAALKKKFVHLTNYSINKKNIEGYQRNLDKAGEAEQGDGENSSKWSLYQLKRKFEKMGIDYSYVKGRIKDVIIKTLISVEPHIINTMSRSTRYRNVCFEVYGFDILIDSKLKPWLLEVNISPSLSSSSPFDKKVKTMLICDVLNLTGVYAYDRKKFQKEQEQLIRKRLLGMDKSPKTQPKDLDNQVASNPNLAKIFKLLTSNEKNFNLINEDDLSIITDFEEEQQRLGNFDLIFPLAQNVTYYDQFFENPRYGNETLWKYLRQLHHSQKAKGQQPL